MPQLSERSLQRLIGVHPDLVKVVRVAVLLSPLQLTILEGVRTLERQKLLLKQGATTTMNSRHLDGHAVDIAPEIDTDHDGDLEVSWSWPLYYEVAKHMKAAAAQVKVPIEWGGDWRKFKDGPHWQLPWASYK